MAKEKKKAIRKLKKALKKQLQEPTRYRFFTDEDGHDYLIPDYQADEFKLWLEAGPYWEDYEGEDFDIYRIDGLFDYTFTDPRNDR